MRQKWANLSKKSQVIIVAVLILTISVVAYAAISTLISKSVTSNLTKGDIMEMQLSQDVIIGEVVPGDSIAISPSVINTGTRNCLAFVKIEMPTYGNAGANAYTFTAASDWIKVSEGNGAEVYGYSRVLGSGDDTSKLCDYLTMVNMSNSDFNALNDINVTVTGYLADFSEYGENLVEAWNRISSGN